MRALITRFLACLLVCCLFSSVAQAQWEATNLGTLNPTQTAMGVNQSDGTPYVLFSGDAANRAQVRSWNGTEWVAVGNADFSMGAIIWSNIVVSPEGVPYVAFRDAGNENKATVMRLNSTSNTWETIFTSAGEATHTTMAFNKAGTLHITYIDATQANKAVVMQYTGTASEWVPVGPAEGISAGAAAHSSIAFDSNDNLYLTYSEGNAAVVQRFTGTIWVSIGSASLMGVYATNTDIAIGPDNVPYLLIRIGDSNTTRAARVFRLEGDAWVAVGAETGFGVVFSGTTANPIDYMNIEVSNDNVPYVGMMEGNATTSHNRPGVYRFNAATSAWEHLGGGQASSSTNASHEGFALHKASNTAYISARDASTTGRPLFVWRYACGPAISMQPTTAEINDGEAATLSVAAEGVDLTYQWQVDMGNGFENITDNDNYSGATTATLNIAAATVPMNRYNYRVMFTSACGSVASDNVALSVMPAPAAWITAGGVPASEGGAIWSQMDVDSKGVPYVLYNEGGYMVRRLVNGVWEPVGAALNATSNNNTANFPYIKLDHNDVPYVAYQDNSPDNGNRLTVQRFNGTSWELVGGATGISTGDIRWAYINFDNNNVPYVAHRDIAATRGRIIRFVNNAWEYLPTNFGGGISEHPNITFDSNNNLFVAYRDATAGWRAAVKKYNEATSTWDALGTVGFNAGGHTGEVGNVYLALDNNEVPHVLINDGNASNGLNKAVVMRFNGTDWETVGTNADGTSPGFSGGNINNSTGTSYLAFGADNRPVAHFTDAGPGRGVFMTLNDQNRWVLVGGEVATVNGMTHSGAVMDKASGTMYLSYRNTGDGGKIYVRSYAAGPYMAASPADREVDEGDALTLTGRAVGNDLTYQWQVDKGNGLYEPLTEGPVYSGTNTPTLTIGFADASFTGYKYRMVASAAFGAAATDAAALTVIPSSFCYPPEITSQPVAAVALCQGLDTNFMVETTGTEVVYQWQVSADGTTFTNIENNDIYSGANEATLIITGATLDMNENVYKVLVTGACAPAQESNLVALTVNQNPTIAVEPVNAPASCIGSDVNFTVGAIGAEVAYKWQVDTGAGFEDIVDGDEYSGATTNTLRVVGATTAMNSNLYRAVLSGTCLPTDTTTLVSLNVYQPFAAGEVQPGPGICYNTVPAAITSTTLASGGDGNFTYTWEMSTDGTTWQPISGATNTAYAPTAAHTQSTYYRRGVNNATCGTTIYSAPVMVEVYGDLAPGVISGTQTVGYGHMPLMLASTTDATGGNVVAYQWEQSIDGSAFTPIPNATGRTFTPAGAGERTITYRRVATSVNGCGTVISNSVTVTVAQREFVISEVPNALLPNGNDEQNRRWGISHMGLSESVRVRVFDKTGQTVFETDNAQTEWDGRYKGKLVPEGAYFFSIERAGGNRLSGSIKVIY